MKFTLSYKRLIPLLCGCGLAASLTPVSVSAFEDGSLPALETDTLCSVELPALETDARSSLELPVLNTNTLSDTENQETTEENSEESAASGVEAQAKQDLPFLIAKFQEKFGDSLPQWMDLGSFTLNRLYGISAPAFTENGWLIEDADGVSWLLRFSWATLERKITSILEASSGDWSVYLKDLSTGNTMEINEHAMQAASLIKLYIAGTTLEKIETGELEETDTIREALYNMITVSDNESANVLVRSFCDESGDFQTGLAEVNDFIARYGFSNTEQINGIADPSLWVSDGRVNETSAADCGHLLELLYKGELVSEDASSRFESLLNQQEVNYKIPAALPEGTNISHKTGEVNDTENDVAIIYTPYGDYIFCILSTDLSDTDAAVDTIHTVTRLVYDWFTQPEIQQADHAAMTTSDGDGSDTENY